MSEDTTVEEIQAVESFQQKIADIELKDADDAAETPTTSSIKTNGDTLIKDDISNSQRSSSKFSIDDSSELDQLLQAGHLNGGCFGLLERLPLFVKMFMMLVVSLIGIFAIGLALTIIEGRSISNARSEKTFASGVVTSASIINDLAKERELSSLYITSTRDKELYFQQLTAQRELVDKRLVNFRNVAKSNGWSGKLIDIERALKLIERIRSRVNRLSVPASDIVNYYSNTIALITDFMLTLGDTKSKIRMGLNAMVLVTVNAGLTRSIGSIVFADSAFTSENYQEFIERYANENAFSQFLTPLIGEDYTQKYTDLLSEYDVRYQQILNFALENRDNELNVDPDDWYNITVSRGDQMLIMEQFLASLVTDAANDSLRRATVGIVIVCIAVVLVWLAAIGTAYLFSRAITGPWQRLLKVQESTIKKFVPKGFLKLVKCYRLADLTLGKSVQRDLTIMIADIRDFTSISESMTPGQLFSLLNKYLAWVGPIVRRKGGYIDKLLGDSMIVCFPTMTVGIESCLAMQTAVDQLNKENPDGPQLKIGIGLTCGSVMVGAIGENERMEGTIISDCVPIAARLESLTKPFGARILTTGEAMKRVKNPKSLHYRPLGYVKAKCKKGVIKVYEILERQDKLKIDSAKKFREAVDLMIKHEYETAITIFKDLLKKNSADKGCERLLNTCLVYFRNFTENVNSMRIEQALRIENVRDAFGDYASMEQDNNLFKCWSLIQEYKRANNDKERMQVMKNLNDKFLKPDGPQKVPVDEQWQKRVETIFVDYHLQSKSPDTSLFSTLQQELETLMSESFNTFKKNPMFTEAYKKSLSIPIVNISEEETL